jgi:sRNA-binding protein
LSNLTVNDDLGDLDGGAGSGKLAATLSAREERYARRALLQQKNSVTTRKTSREKRKSNSKTTKTQTSLNNTTKNESFIARMRSPWIPPSIPLRITKWKSKHAESMRRYDNKHNS